MQGLSRRGFLQAAAAVAAASVGNSGSALAAEPEPMRMGLLVSATNGPEKVMEYVRGFGIPTVHVSTSDFSRAMSKRLRDALDSNGIEATALVSSGPGEQKYDLYDGPITYGLVASPYRAQRVDHLKRTSDFGKGLGIPVTFNQWGYIPEVPSAPLYEPTVKAVQEIAAHCKANGQIFVNETGQETPVTLLRTILDTGMDNVKVVLDAANLILYGKGSPVDSLDVIGKYVIGVHAKDGFYPTNPRYLGRQVACGQGKVDWPRLIPGLKKLGYTGPITIEPVLGRDQRDQEIREDMAYLKKLIAES
ncbi:MAG TPA: sugar phosphate isomerase/epimerase family protein [Terriglobia bacterium]|nr:sugar phosphate isomerase/epimerase family protein [Terriglobia bacterium]